MANIAILGCGFGTALAVMTDKCGHNVSLWSKYENEINQIKATRENKQLLPNVIISDSITLTSDLKNCVLDKEIILIAIPSFAMRSVVTDLKKCISKDAVVVSVAKGFDNDSLKTMSQILEEELDNPIVVLSGPSHAEEIALGFPTTVVATSKSQYYAKYIQTTLANDNLRIYTNNDIVGVELGGALKNAIALAAGILDGLKMGDNAKAALVTRGLNEIASLGVHYGARKQTFAGLTGIGDLFVTCTSLHSRNYSAGLLIGQGKTPDEALKIIGKTVEGYTATKNAYELMKESSVPMPLIEQIYLILYKNKHPKDALSLLMNRPLRDEEEHIWLD